MNIQEKAFHIIYDIIGVVIKWDKNELSDKDAMNGIVDILASHAEDENENEVKNMKKLNYFKFRKKLVAPIAISVIFIGIFFGIGILNHIFPITETQTSVNENKIGFEQLNENISNKKEKILNNTTIEEFNNITNFDQG
jgi:hypothetical protein